MNRSRKPMPLNAKMVFRGVIFEVWQWEQEMYDGSSKTFERLRRANTADVIATIGNKILVLTQEQPDSRGSFISIPGGRVDPGEEPLQTGKRELLEETGYASDDWSLLIEENPVGKIEWTIYTYVARNCRKVAEAHPDAGEKIQTRLVDFEEFLMLSEEPSFYEGELVDMLLRARLDPAQKEGLRQLLFGAHA